MRYSSARHEDLKQQALALIERGALDAFLSLKERITYTGSEAYEEEYEYYSGPTGEYDDGYRTGYRTAYRDVELEYLNTVEDIQDFLNHALEHAKKPVIDYLLSVMSKNMAISVSTPILLSRDLFAAYAHRMGISSAEIHSFDALFDQISILRNKIIDLDQRGHESAAICAYQLALNLQKEMLNYVSANQGKRDPKQFKKNCNEHLENAAKSELAQHRGYKKLFLNLSLAISNVIYLGAAAINYYCITDKKHFWFHPKTKSEIIIEDTKKAFEKWTAPRLT